MSFSLNGQWLLYYGPETGKLPFGVEDAITAGWSLISATVPGNVELDLWAAGVENDPFYGENIYDYRKYEFYGWIFRREFELPGELDGKRVVLNLHGVDTFAAIYVNGTAVGETANMLIAHQIDVTSALLPSKNEIVIHIASSLNRAREYEFPAQITGAEGSDEMVRLRKPPSCFGWDIAPRFISAGIWRDIELVELKPTRITEVYYQPSTHGVQAKLRFVSDERQLEGYSVRISGFCGESTFSVEQPLRFVSDTIYAHVPNPKLWWPKGYGEQNLYEVTLKLLRNRQVIDSRTEKIGLRQFEIEKKYDPSNADAGEFKIKCNGVPILAKGSNWVPVDALHSRDAARIGAVLELLSDVSCNIVRCWGGNVYEDHTFFDFCDRHGIMVWQDFAMACAIYPQDDQFCETLRQEAIHVVKKLRNHASLLTWAGDNEVDEAYFWTGNRLPHSRHNRLTREVLPQVVAAHDPMREYIPSSPYIPEEFPSAQNVPEQHNWGPRDYFKGDFYKHSNAHFISECGYHGCPSPQSLSKFIPADQLWPMEGSDAWDTHNTDYIRFRRRGYNRNGLMTDQVKVMFGQVPADLEGYSLASQLSQAEAKKFFIEATRMKKWRRTGIIWWNLMDCWPQISDAVVDYYFEKKVAYHYIKRVQQPICIMMGESEGWHHRVVLGNDSNRSREVKYTITDGDSGEVLMAGAAHSPANGNVDLGSLRSIPGEQRLYLISWEIEGNSQVHRNHYISGYVPFDFYRYSKIWLPKLGIRD